MIRKVLGMALMGLALVVTSASGAIVFQDDFSTGLDQWTVTGDTAWESAGGTMFVGYTTAAEPWHSTATTNASFTASGTYTLTFDTNGNTFPSSAWQDVNHTFVVMPGGLQVSYGYWNNPGTVLYKGAVLSDSAAVNANNINWRSITMIADYDAMTAEVLVNTGSGNVSIWSGSLQSAPDFTTYQKITMFSQLSTDFNSYDNVVLNFVPEPLTMSLLAVGSLGLLARRKR